MTVTGESVDITVNITITQLANEAPIIAILENTTITQDTNATLTFSASDPENDTVNATVKTEPLNGSVTIGTNTVTYSPDEGFYGEDTFTITFSDGENNVDKTVTVTVTEAGNSLPSIAISSYVTLEQDSYVDIIFNITDDDGDTVNVSIVSQPLYGTLTLNDSNVTYTPSSGYYGKTALP